MTSAAMSTRPHCPTHRFRHRVRGSAFARTYGGLLASALAVAGLTALSPIASQPASAYCVSGATISYRYSTLWGREGANTGTCDGLGDYWAYYNDLNNTDGFRVAVQHDESGSWVMTPMTNGTGNYGWAFKTGTKHLILTRSDNTVTPWFSTAGY